MKRTILVLSLCTAASAIYAQGSASAQLLSEQLEDIAIVYSEPIEVMVNEDQAMIQAPSSTYMLEVLDQQGLVVAQDPFNTYMSINMNSWKEGTYVVLAHTFNGLKQVEFQVKPKKQD